MTLSKTPYHIRKYGKPPFSVAVIHGGPGAPGSMAPVARELLKSTGVIEPLQTAGSIEGQVEELRAALADHASLPVILIGHSWGAWLSFIFAARHPEMVKKIILVGSGPFEEKYASSITETRLGRLKEDEWAGVRSLMKALDDPEIKDKEDVLARFGALMSRADAYDPLPEESDEIRIQPGVFRSVWAEAEEFRRTGELLRTGARIRCPVVAIHGDYDPHPAAGVEKPLSRMLKDFRFILLEKCGHEPWKERQAKEHFYEVLREEL